MGTITSIFLMIVSIIGIYQSKEIKKLKEEITYLECKLQEKDT